MGNCSGIGAQFCPPLQGNFLRYFWLPQFGGAATGKQSGGDSSGI